MKFVFDELKSAQAASILLERSGGSMPYIKLIKLLYLADRASLIDTGSPITGDRFVSMKYGPVLSRVLTLIKTAHHSENSIWGRYVQRNYFDAVLVGSAEADHLSDYDEELLNNIFDAYGSWNSWDVVDRTHALPEWNDPGDTSVPIEPEEILRFAGYDEEELRFAVEQADAVYSLRTQLARAT
jgi:uncharacterized phage-associated protein